MLNPGGMVLALWDRGELATDSTATDGGAAGGYSGIFIDPDGHPWEIARHPYWTIAQDGSVDIG